MLAFLEYLYTDHCSIEDGDSVGILELSNEYMMPRLTSLCELYLKNEVDRATSKSIPLVDIDVICKYNSLYPHTPSLIPYPHTLIPSYPHTPSLIPLPSYPTLIPLPSYPHTTTLIPYPHTPTLITYPHTLVPLPSHHHTTILILHWYNTWHHVTLIGTKTWHPFDAKHTLYSQHMTPCNTTDATHDTMWHHWCNTWPCDTIDATHDTIWHHWCNTKYTWHQRMRTTPHTTCKYM